MANGSFKDPFGNYNFHVEIGGISRAAFQQVSGLDSSIEVTEYREGGDLTSHKLPGQVKYSNVQLKWGVTDELELYNWHRLFVDGGEKETDRKLVAIVLLDRKGEAKARWELTRAWPAKYVASDFNAEGNDVAIETIELAHEGIKRSM